MLQDYDLNPGVPRKQWALPLMTPLTLPVLLLLLLPCVNTACAAAAVRMQEGMLPIHFAAMFNRLDVVAMLLDKGSHLQPPPAKKVGMSCRNIIMACLCLYKTCSLWGRQAAQDACDPRARKDSTWSVCANILQATSQQRHQQEGAQQTAAVCAALPVLAPVSTEQTTTHHAVCCVLCLTGSAAGDLANHPPDCCSQDGPP
jgi:hypothetical protein